MTMIHEPKTYDATPANEAGEMEKLQKDAAKDRENDGGYQ
jgi:hypothetical protein